MESERKIRILMLVHELEKALGELYTVFGERFPAHRALWGRLVEEEHAHAEAVRKLYQLTYAGKSAFDEGKLRPEAVQSIVDYLRQSIDAARREEFTALRALTTTHDLERSLVEKDIFSHFRVAEAYAPLLQVLREGTQEHIRMAKTEIDKLPAQGGA